MSLMSAMYKLLKQEKKRVLVNKKGAGKVLETNEARFRDLWKNDRGSDSENECISLFQKMGHCFQNVHFPNSEQWTKPIGEMTFAFVPAHLIVRFMTHRTKK